MANGFMGFILGGLGGFLGGLIIGALLMGALGYVMTGGTNIPYNTQHTKIAEGFKVTITHELTLKHVLSTEAAINPYSSLDVFTPHVVYGQSLWTFSSGDDIDVTMTIWGPGNDGATYLVEFGRHAGDAITIAGWNQSVSWPSNSNEGYASMSITP